MTRPLLRPCAVALSAAVVIGVMGAAHGGWGPQTWRLMTVALACLTAATLLTKDRVVVSHGELFALASLAALAGWMLLSLAWSGHAHLATLEAERCALYLSALLLVVVAVEAGEEGRLVAGLLAGIVFISAWALVSYCLDPGNLRRLGLLVGPVRYANGQGVLAAIGIVLSLGFASRARTPRARLLQAAPLLVLVPALVLTRSWGAWGALALVALATQARHPRRAGALAVGGGVSILLVWTVVPSLFTDITHNPRWSYWGAALHDYVAHPALGSGAGTYWLYWTAHPRPVLPALDAHSLYLESLAELGPVGLGLILAFLAPAFLAGRRPGLGRMAAWALGVYALHGAVDWDWELPVVTLVAVGAAGAALVRSRANARVLVLGVQARYGLAVVSVALAVVSLARLRMG